MCVTAFCTRRNSIRKRRRPISCRKQAITLKTLPEGYE